MAVPTIACVHTTHGFDTLFHLLSLAALATLLASLLLPGQRLFRFS